jgi:GntR family transcriptional regulator, transcriptional repressor for pyruvate dehydrogenase complex
MHYQARGEVIILDNEKAPIGFGTFARDAIPERITQRIISLIREEHLKPGDKLPPERELASMMQVSRPSLREALRALSLLNIIEIRQGDGTYVSSLTLELLIEPLDLILMLDNSTIQQLFEARKKLEVGIASLAAERITTEELEKIEAILDRSKKVLSNHELFLQNDIELHDMIAQAAKNPILYRLLVSLSRLGKASRQKTVEIPGVAAQTVNDHKAIVEALRNRNPLAAEQSMLAHLSFVEKRLMELIVE